MNFVELLKTFTDAVEAGDGAALAACFTEEGVYHDVFYGAFAGRAAIAELLENRFHRDGEDFLWEMLDPVDDGTTGFARWRFSYTARTEASRGRRVVMEGVGYFRLADGRIESYEDYARAGEVLVQLGLAPAHCHRILDKWATRQNARPELRAHLEGAKK